MTKQQEAYEFYTNFVPHVDKVNVDHPAFDFLTEEDPITDEDVENCQLVADYITDQLLHRGKDGACPWWKHDDFKKKDEDGNVIGTLHPVHIEKKICLLYTSPSPRDRG